MVVEDVLVASTHWTARWRTVSGWKVVEREDESETKRAGRG